MWPHLLLIAVPQHTTPPLSQGALTYFTAFLEAPPGRRYIQPPPLHLTQCPPLTLSPEPVPDQPQVLNNCVLNQNPCQGDLSPDPNLVPLIGSDTSLLYP